ncbi:MAG: protein phosphatase CheZ [Methylococcaceae bacterium]
MTDRKHAKRLELAKQLVAALENDQAEQADQILQDIASVTETVLFNEVGKLTRQLHDALISFLSESKLSSMTDQEIPDAKERLNYVITMTEQAANQTLNVVEDILPQSQKLNLQTETLGNHWEQFLFKEMPFHEFKVMTGEISDYFKQVKQTTLAVNSGLNDILMAQGFQDITGQVIRRVINLVQDIELGLVELIRLSGTKTNKSKSDNVAELAGPVVPGVGHDDSVTQQDEVDDLLSSMGF